MVEAVEEVSLHKEVEQEEQEDAGQVEEFIMPGRSLIRTAHLPATIPKVEMAEMEGVVPPPEMAASAVMALVEQSIRQTPQTYLTTRLRSVTCYPETGGPVQ